MEFKISKSTIFFLFYSIVVLLPSYFANSFFDLMDNLYLILGCLYLFSHKFIFDKYTLAFSAYMALTVLVTYMNGNPTANIHLIISYMKIIVYICVVRDFYRERRDTAVNILFYILLVIVLVDFTTILMHPDGLYFEEFAYNQWSRGKSIYWILGNKNNHTIYYLLCLYLATCRVNNLKKDKLTNILPTVIAAISVVAMIILESSTSIFVCMVVLGAVVFIFNKRKEISMQFNMYYVWLFYVVLFFLIIYNSATFLLPIVRGLFGKDLTFTGRLNAWGNVILEIGNRPWLGSGVLNSKTSSRILGALSFTNAHNTFLQILWQVGIWGFTIYSMLYIFITNSINRIKNKNVKMFNIIFFAALLIKMIFEVESGMIFFLLLFVIYLETSQCNDYLEKSMFNE